MASKTLVDEAVVKRFETFRQGTPLKFNQSASTKLIKDCFKGEGLPKPMDLVNMCEASVFPKLMDKSSKSITLKTETVTDYLDLLAVEISKRKKGSSAPDIRKTLESLVLGVDGPKSSATKTGKQAGVVDRLTDTKGYTGSHVNRFDAEGKGKGAAGRKDMTQNTGYVGAYKEAGTYDKKH